MGSARNNDAVDPLPGKKPPAGSSGTFVKAIGPFLTLGLQLALAVVAFFFLGRWLDSWLDTSPWLMIAGLALGIAGGFVQFFRTAISLGRAEDKRAEERRKSENE